MVRLSGCIEMLYAREEPDVAARIGRAHEDGLPAVEFWGWRQKNLDAIAEAAQRAGVAVAAFVAEHKGPIVDAANAPAFVEGVEASAEQARRLGCGTLLVLTGQALPGVPREAQHDAVVEALRRAAPAAERAGVTLVLEPLNTLVDHKGHFLDSAREGFDIVRAVGSPAVKLLYDVYHMQIMEGNIIQTIRDNAALIGHYHVADVPGRREPGTGELNWRNIVQAIAETGYAGYVGLEYRPTGATPESLALIKSVATEIA